VTRFLNFAAAHFLAVLLETTVTALQQLKYIQIKGGSKMFIINAIENLLGNISKNKDLILSIIVVSIILGIIGGLIVAPWFI
jgi:hypothetical protein